MKRDLIWETYTENLGQPVGVGAQVDPNAPQPAGVTQPAVTTQPTQRQKLIDKGVETGTKMSGSTGEAQYEEMLKSVLFTDEVAPLTQLNVLNKLFPLITSIQSTLQVNTIFHSST